MKIAYLYAGQGAQYAGMGEELLEAYPELETYYDMASDVVGYDMKALCFTENDQLNETKYTQPAILTVSMAFTSLLDKAGIQPSYLAGLSLGEYSALVKSGVFDFKTAVDIVSHRGEYMEEAVPSGEGKMVAVLKTDRHLIEEKCRQAADETGEYVAPANYNTPAQIVIGGTVKAVDRAAALLKEAGAKKMVELKVSGPFHTALLKPASQKLGKYLDHVTFHQQEIPVISNTTAKPHVDGEIKERLTEQVMKPVRWEDSIRYMIAQGVDTVVEIGPGKTLSSFMKAIDKSIAVHRVENVKTLDETLSSLQGGSND